MSRYFVPEENNLNNENDYTSSKNSILEAMSLI